MVRQLGWNVGMAEWERPPGAGLVGKREGKMIILKRGSACPSKSSVRTIGGCFTPGGAVEHVADKECRRWRWRWRCTERRNKTWLACTKAQRCRASHNKSLEAPSRNIQVDPGRRRRTRLRMSRATAGGANDSERSQLWRGGSRRHWQRQPRGLASDPGYTC